MTEELRSVRQITILTRKIGVIGLILVSCYFLFLYKQYDDALTPEFMVDYGVSEFQSHLTDARSQLVTMVRGRLPHLLNNLERGLLDGIPSIRTKLLDETQTEVDTRLAEITSIMDLNLTRALKSKENAHLLDVYQEPSATDRLAKQVVRESFRAADAQLVASSGRNLDKHLSNIVAGPTAIFNYLKRIRTNSNPSDQEKAQRELLILVASSFGSNIDMNDSSHSSKERIEHSRSRFTSKKK